MKVISLLQPWATLIVIGAKKIETRSWKDPYRGPLLIHASLGKKDYAREVATLADRFGVKKPAFDDLPFGAIIGQVNLEDIHPTERMQGAEHVRLPNGMRWDFTEQEMALGDYTIGRYGWLLSNPVSFDTPIPAKGSLRLWEYGYEPV